MPSVTSITALLSISTFTLSQSLSTSEAFVLYPYITSGSLTGPYPNNAIDRSQPLSTYSGYESGTFTSDCFNRYTFTSYIGTHCTGQDQCGYRRWSLNQTSPASYSSAASNTLNTYTGSRSGMLIGEADETGKRDVGWSNPSDCEDQAAGTSGFGISSSEDQEIVHLLWENPEDETDVFGTFYTCWIDGDIYGPRLYYHNADGTTPEGCADLLLVPRCTTDSALVQTPVTSQCYQGGLPA